MRFSVLKLQFLLQKWIQHPQLPMGHPFYAIPITEKLPFEQFLPDFGQKTHRILGANGLEISQLLAKYLFANKYCSFVSRS